MIAGFPLAVAISAALGLILATIGVCQSIRAERAERRAAFIARMRIRFPDAFRAGTGPPLGLPPKPVKAKTFDEWIANTAELLEECRERRS